MADHTTTDAAILARLAIQTCIIEGCSSPRHSDRGRYCELHNQRRRRTGDPNGEPLPKRKLREIHKTARGYILRNQEALPLAAGLRWATYWLHTAQASGEDWAAMSHDRVRDTLLFRMERAGVEPADILARLAACHHLRDYEQGAIVSDSHFEFQVGKALLQIIPFPKRYERSVAGTGVTRSIYLKPTPGVFQSTYRSIPVEGHLLAHNIAAKLNAPKEWQAKTLAPMKWSLPNH